MSKVIKAEQTPSKKPTSSKKKWREIEDLRDRYALMKELQEDDFCLEMDMEELGI